MVELIDILTDDGLPMGKTVEVAEAHRRGLWRAGVHVGLYTADRRVLVQQRSKTILFYPGYWDLGVGGVVAHGENIYESALRHAEESLGVEARHLQYVTRWKYNHRLPAQGIHAKVFMYAFIAEIDPAQLRLQHDEIQDVRLLPLHTAHEALFAHKGLPLIQVKPYERYYRQILTSIEQHFRSHHHGSTDALQ